MDSRAFWLRLKTHRWVYSFSIVSTLTLGILIGSVVSYGSEGQGRPEVFVFRRDSARCSVSQAAFR